MTALLFRDDAYLKTADAVVVAHTDQGGVVPDGSLFYATGGGKFGDSGRLIWPGAHCVIATCIKGDGDDLTCVPCPSQPLPEVGASVRMELDWRAARRICGSRPRCI